MNEQMTITGISRIIGLGTDGTLILFQQSLFRWTACLLVSGALGAVATLSAFVIGVLSITSLGGIGADLSALNKALAAISFPLFILAAHCMDRVDEVKREIRQSS